MTMAQLMLVAGLLSIIVIGSHTRFFNLFQGVIFLGGSKYLKKNLSKKKSRYDYNSVTVHRVNMMLFLLLYCMFPEYSEHTYFCLHKNMISSRMNILLHKNPTSYSKSTCTVLQDRLPLKTTFAYTKKLTFTCFSIRQHASPHIRIPATREMASQYL